MPRRAAPAIDAIERVRSRYDRVGRGVPYWAISLAGFGGMERWYRSQAVARLRLRPGDAVLDVACGRGGNFPHLERAVGARGRIVGLDCSPTMLAGAGALVRRNGWTNVELVRGDASAMAFEAAFDAALCTVAMTVIPEWRRAVQGMVRAVRPGGRVAILDGRLGRGAWRAWNPSIRAFSKVVAAHLDRDIPAELRRWLPDAAEEPLFGPLYFVASGTRPDGTG